MEDQKCRNISYCYEKTENNSMKNLIISKQLAIGSHVLYIVTSSKQR